MSEPLNLDSILENVEKSIDEYKTKVKINCIKDFDEDIEQWINADSDGLNLLTSDQILEVAHLFLRYKTYLTYELACEKTKLKTIQNIIDQWAAPYWRLYKMYMPDNIRYYTICRTHNTALEKPLKLRNWIQLRIASVEDMIKVIQEHYYFYMSYAKSKA